MTRRCTAGRSAGGNEPSNVDASTFHKSISVRRNGPPRGVIRLLAYSRRFWDLYAGISPPMVYAIFAMTLYLLPPRVA